MGIVVIQWLGAWPFKLPTLWNCNTKGLCTLSPCFLSQIVACLKVNTPSHFTLNHIYTPTPKLSSVIIVFGTGSIFCIFFASGRVVWPLRATVNANIIIQNDIWQADFKPPGRASGWVANLCSGQTAVLQLPCPSRDATGPQKDCFP